MRLVGSAFILLFAAWSAFLLPHDRAHAAPAGQPCGGAAGGVCDKGLWCEPPTGGCASAGGICVAVPRVCVARKNSKNFRPVCGCNGKTYSSDCFRRAYRVAKAHDGKCDRSP
jgi:hypothetical protein